MSSLQRGSAFQLEGQNSSRIWLVLSEVRGAGDVAIVPIEPWSPDGDATCVVHPNDHPSVSRRSFIYYARARLAPVAALVAAETGGKLFIREPVAAALLDRVIAGIQDSPHTPPAVRDGLL